MAALGFVALPVASLLLMLGSVVGAPMNPGNYFNALDLPFDSVSHALRSSHPGEHEPELSPKEFDPFADHDPGWRPPSSFSARGPATIDTAAVHPNWQEAGSLRALQPHRASHYAPDMTASHFNDQPWYPTATHARPQQYQALEPWQQQQHLARLGERSSIGTRHQPNDAWMHTVDGGASSSRGGAGPSGQHPGFQHQPPASIGPGSGSYGAFEPWLQHQHLNSPNGEGSYDHDNLQPYTREQIDEMVNILNSPDVSALPRSHAVQADAPRDATADRKRRKSKGRLEGTSAQDWERADAHQAAPTKLNEAIKATYDDLLNYSYLWEKGDPILEPDLALGRLTDKDLVRHAEIAFQVGKTALQTPLRRSADGSASLAFVYSTKHQTAIIQELINRKLEHSPVFKGGFESVRITADRTSSFNEGSVIETIARIHRSDLVARQGPFEGLQGSIGIMPYDAPFTLGAYGIYLGGKFRDRASDRMLQKVYAIPTLRFDRMAGGDGGRGRKRPADEPKSILLGILSSK